MRKKRFVRLDLELRIELKLCANVLTQMFYRNTVALHNKQGGRGRRILPD